MGALNTPNVGDILVDKQGIYYRVLMYCKHSENQSTMVVYESIKSKGVFATPLTIFTIDWFKVAIKVEDLQP